MIWSYFFVFASVSVVLWAIGAWAAWRSTYFDIYDNEPWTCSLFRLYTYYVDNIRTTTASYNGRNTFMV